VTVSYGVRPHYLPHSWSNQVAIAYPDLRLLTREREASEAKRAERVNSEHQAREVAKREAKERAEREAKELAEREAKEHLERERREREEHGGSVVNAAPTGPLPPAGGWHVAFADGVGAALGSSAGQDNFWYPNEGGCCHPYVTAHGNNTNELEGYNASQVHVGASELELVDEYHPNAMPAEGSWPVRYLHTQPKMALILSNALRSVGGVNPDPQFTSGARTWDIRAISVYEDGAHAGQNIEGGGMAPGTVVK
jgi:hypothetical protein